MIDHLLAVTPVTYHVAVRDHREHRVIPVEEADDVTTFSPPDVEP